MEIGWCFLSGDWDGDRIERKSLQEWAGISFGRKKTEFMKPEETGPRVKHWPGCQRGWGPRLKCCVKLPGSSLYEPESHLILSLVLARLDFIAATTKI